MQKLKNEKGYAMIIALFAVVMIAILGVSLITVSGTTLTTTTHERVNQSSFYIAEAGINIKSANIEQQIQKKYEELQSDPSQFNTKFKNELKSILQGEQHSVYSTQHFKTTINGTPKAEVNVIFSHDNPFEFKIISVGQLDGKHERSLEKKFAIDSAPLSQSSNTEIIEGGIGIIYPPANTVPAADMYISNYINFTGFKNENLNATLSQRKSADLDDTYVGLSLTSENTKNIRSKIKFHQSFTIPPRIAPTINPTTIDASLASIDPKIFDTKESNVTHKLNLTESIQTINSNAFLPEIKNGSNLNLNLNVVGNQNLFLFEGTSKYNFTNLTINVTGTGSLNIVVDDTLNVSKNRIFKINAPNNKVNLLLKKGANFYGQAYVQNIYSHSGELDIHDYGVLHANDIYSNNGDIDINNYSNLIAKNIHIQNKDFKIYSNGKATVQNIKVVDGDLDLNNSSQLNAENIALNDGDISISNSVQLTAKDILIKDGILSSFSHAKINAHNILIDKGRIWLSTSVILNAQNIFIQDGYFESLINSKITTQTLTTASGSVRPYLGSIIVADTLNVATTLRIDARLNVNKIYAQSIYGTEEGRINATVDRGEGHYGKTDDIENTTTTSDFLDFSQLINSDPTIEID